MEPRDRPLVCLASRSKLHENNIGCCTNGDACNANMTLDLTPKHVDADDSLSLGGKEKEINADCCIFRPAFGCCAFQTLVEIVIFSVFLC